MHPRIILIDGYNVTRNTRGLQPEDGVALATARENLLAMVRAKFRGTPHRVSVVFDGDGEREVTYAIKGLAGGQCIFTQRGMSADEVIVRLHDMAVAGGLPVAICTNDIEIRDKTATGGTSHVSVAQTTQALNAPDKYTAKRMKHAAYVRRQSEPLDDEPPSHSRKGNPRRAPKKPRGRGEHDR
jgi:predicted RNA-binding protein with PIN domain